MVLLFFYALLFSVAFMGMFWLLYLAVKNPAIVDFAWTLCVGGITFIYFYLGEMSFSLLFVFILMMCWMVRLAFLVAYRLFVNKSDGRYDDLDKKWGSNKTKRYFTFFMMQGLAAFIMTLPILFVAGYPDFRGFSIVAIVFMIIGLFGVIYSDISLQTFLRRPENREEVCEKGLWRYSRHPNYFFEWIYWVGLYFFAIATPWGWMTIISPLLLIWTLFFATGIPPLEKRAVANKGEKYKDYQKRVSVFIPWFPKKKVENR